jgi:hypothetical protein
MRPATTPTRQRLLRRGEEGYPTHIVGSAESEDVVHGLRDAHVLGLLAHNDTHLHLVIVGLPPRALGDEDAILRSADGGRRLQEENRHLRLLPLRLGQRTELCSEPPDRADVARVDGGQQLLDGENPGSERRRAIERTRGQHARGNSRVCVVEESEVARLLWLAVVHLHERANCWLAFVLRPLEGRNRAHLAVLDGSEADESLPGHSEVDERLDEVVREGEREMHTRWGTSRDLVS